jgi:Ca-activated chloride channel homolog
MVFDNPVALALIPVLLIVLGGLGRWGWSVKREIAETLALEWSRWRRKQIEKYLILSLLGALLLVAAALPKTVSSALAPPDKAGEIALLVDVSGSMAAQQDIRSPSRLARCQSMLIDMVDHLEELGQPRVSLHGFTNIARSHVPWVGKEDYGYLTESISKLLGINSTPGQGSVLGQSILDVAAKFSQGKSVKLIVLFSDGEPFLGATRGLRPEERALLDQAIAKARNMGIVIVTVGVGEREGAKIPIYNAQGEFTGAYAQFAGSDFVTYLVEDQLKEIAERTGGRYFPESRRGELIPYLRDTLASADSVGTAKEIKVYQSLAPWFLLAALPIWVVFVRRHLLD